MAEDNSVVGKETAYAAAWTLALSLVMEAVFLIAGAWGLPVLLGNIGGAAAAVGNIFLLARAAEQAVESGSTEAAMRRIRASKSLRMAGIAAVCVLCIAVLKTNVYATLIPLVFPRIGYAFRPAVNRGRATQAADSEGSDRIE